MLFPKTTIKKIAAMEPLTNCGENPYETPMKKLIFIRDETVIL